MRTGNSTYPAEFIYDNLVMATNAIHAAYVTGVERLLFLGSTCIYPRMAPQPMPVKQKNTHFRTMAGKLG